ncbi:MarR family transcriptional regulator [Ktedonosporobacter rubrisoli]|uniref:MarR family transcriptional regulator n=1 Tax=Ktedonosporobacter rubrisoli TaxID=2509675 RepID=A0A4P6JKM3_KTERU|nr:MarR family transcriptional regulator [Ktedonosporobacter rubrisoli]QBD75728.1 MarR family transcriptional regulator [Ktedonosporobacter rubrisoli]
MGDFIGLFSQVTKASKEAFERTLQQYGLHAGQHFLLEQLWDAQEDLTIGELASRLDVEDPSITRSVQRMARQGLVEKYPHPIDARQVLVRLTLKGQALEPVIRQIMATGEEYMLTNVSPIERALLMRILAQIQENLEQKFPFHI